MLLVITATANEMKAAFAWCDAPTVAQGEAVEFEVNGRKLLLAVSGVGMVNAALTAGRLLERDGVEGLVNLGIAGAFELGELPLTTSTYAWVEVWPEFGLQQEDGTVDPKGLGFAQGEVNGKPLWNKLKLNPTNDAKAMGLPLGELWQRVASVSVNGVTNTPVRTGWLSMSCGANIENMEGFALGYGAMQKGVPFLEVRTISNQVGSREAEDWDLKGALAALGKATQDLLTG